jgi:hypothetical protein
MLQDASNFYFGTGIVSRLYMGETLVWPSPSGNLWQFTDNPFSKTLSGFRVTYTNGNIIADWGDGSTSGIVSNINYTHVFQPCESSSSSSSSFDTSCYINNYGQTFTSTLSNNCSDTNNPSGFIISGINTNARKRCYIQGIDSGVSYPNGWVNTYGNLVLWDGEQDGTIFQTGDLIKIFYGLGNRVDVNAIYQVTGIIPNPTTGNYQNSQALLIGCDSP